MYNVVYDGCDTYASNGKSLSACNNWNYAFCNIDTDPATGFTAAQAHPGTNQETPRESLQLALLEK